jgi:signal transduction histidine kinase
MDDNNLMEAAAPVSARDLETVLEAWHTATSRLEQTHEALRAEVRRLTFELEAKNRELARKDRLADLGQMATHVAHEVRNSLVPVSLFLSLLRRHVRHDAGAMEIVEKVSASFRELDATVNDLLSFAADREPRCAPVEVTRLLNDVRDSIAPQLMAQGIRLALDAPRCLVLDADREMLRRALLNLSLNAVDAMPAGGDLLITVTAASDGVELEVADSGPGLSDEARRRAFEPFFTTKHSGTGLGLAIVYRVAEAHGGTVRAMNCPEGGAAFTLRLPAKLRAALRLAA